MTPSWHHRLRYFFAATTLVVALGACSDNTNEDEETSDGPTEDVNPGDPEQDKAEDGSVDGDEDAEEGDSLDGSLDSEE